MGKTGKLKGANSRKIMWNLSKKAVFLSVIFKPSSLKCIHVSACTDVGLSFWILYNQVKVNNVNLQTDVVQRLEVKVTGVFSIAAVTGISFLLHHDVWKNKVYQLPWTVLWKFLNSQYGSEFKTIIELKSFNSVVNLRRKLLFSLVCNCFRTRSLIENLSFKDELNSSVIYQLSRLAIFTRLSGPSQNYESPKRNRIDWYL